MKHIKCMTQSAPAAAILGHPGILQSLLGFISNPIGTLELHLKKDVVS